MKKKTKTLIAALPFLWAVQAQEPIQYELKQCLEIGLEKNYSIKVARNQEQIFKNNVTLGNAGYLPTVDLSGGYSGTINNNKTEGHDGTSTTTNGNHTNNTNVGVNLNWTVFDGLYIQTNYERLKELKRQGELQTRLMVENYMADVAAEYYNCIRQVRLLKTLRYAVSLSRERLRIVEARYDLGDYSRLDLRQAQVDFNADSSKWVKQLEAVKTSGYALNRLMAIDNVYSPFRTSTQEIDLNDRLQGDDLLNKALEANANLLLSARNKRLSELELKSARSRNYPYMRLNGGYGYTLNQYEMATNRSQQNLGFNYGITVGINLFSGFNRSREQKNARIAIINAENNHQELELAIRTDLATLYDAYKNNLALVTLEENNLVVAQENYEIAMERYKLGTLSGIELREAQKSLLDAEERLLTSQYNTKVCEISLLLLAGQITTLIES